MKKATEHMIEHADPAVAVPDEALVADIQRAQVLVEPWPVESATGAGASGAAAAPPRDLVRDIARSMLDVCRSTDPRVIAARLAELASGLDRRDIPNEHGVYLTRWLVRELEDGGRVYLHHFQQSDATEELHNHPWSGFSVILAGGYLEERLLPDGRIARRAVLPGDENELAAETFHRVDLLTPTLGCWTLFGVGAKVQSWGFLDRETHEFTPWRMALARRRIVPTEFV